MKSFKDVTIKKDANIYFNGKVTSRTITFPNGEIKSLGIMLPGAYEFQTSDKEIMEILSGDLIVKLADSDTWQSIKSGDSFEVPSNSSFKVKVSQVTDYCCTYIRS